MTTATLCSYQTKHYFSDILAIFFSSNVQVRKVVRDLWVRFSAVLYFIWPSCVFIAY
jgi:hypothetical protein